MNPSTKEAAVHMGCGAVGSQIAAFTRNVRANLLVCIGSVCSVIPMIDLSGHSLE